ncbi:GcvT family protein [Nesterenkonia populi]
MAPRVVIIGLGVVGSALADELVLRGWNQVTVVDQGPLYVTGGSSSHAPGFVFQTSPSRSMSQLAQRTLDKLDGLEVRGEWVMKRTGGLEIATTAERDRELSRRHDFADAWGIPSRLIGPGEIKALWPDLETSSIHSALHTPTDAVVKGVRAVELQARRAQAGGVQILPNTKVVGIAVRGSRTTGVDVVPVGAAPDAEPQRIEADIVIAAAGLWGPGMARELLGFEIPMLPVEHGFGFSTSVPQLAGLDDRTETVRPMLRHQDHAMYLREWGRRIAVGAYEHRPLPVEHQKLATAEEFERTGVHPAVKPFTEEDFAPTWAEAQRLLPGMLGEGTGVQLDRAMSFNGIFSFTPDGGPLLGPVPNIEGLWMAQAVWVTQSAGVGQVMADWITTGEPGIDTHGLDLARFDSAVVSRRWAREQGEESYDEVYDIVHPKASTLRMRGLRTSPFYERQQALGAVFESASGWERPLWYEANASLGTPMLGDRPLPEREEWAARHWSPVVALEARGMREAVGLVDMSSLPRLTVAGEGATSFLESVLSRPVGRKAGTVVYALLLSEAGGVLSDITVARLGEERYHLGVNGSQDAAWLGEQARRLGFHGLRISAADRGSCGLGLWGPQARTVLEQLTEENLAHESFRFYRGREMSVAGVPVLALRLSYVGELGWELYAPAEFGRFLWDEIMGAGAEHGIIPVGRRAFESMRLEKGFRLWGRDMHREHTPSEAGVGFAVRGAAAERFADAAPPQRKLACLTLDDPAQVLMGGEPVWAAGQGSEVLGYVTSADHGYTVGESIAYAWLPAALAGPGTGVEVGCFGARCPAHVVVEPRFDPAGERMRS